MSSYLESEASASSDEDFQTNHKESKLEDSISSEDSDEEEEIPDEEEICRKEGQGWIVNDDEDDGGDEGSDDESSASEKSARDGGVDEEDVLDDEDYQLIQENVGIDVKRKAKKRRLFLDDDDEADLGVSKASKKARGREAIARQIFEDGEEEEEEEENEARRFGSKPTRVAPTFAAGSDDEGEESDGMDDFIVDNLRPGGTGARQKSHMMHQDPSLQQAQSIFGVDFDFGEFDQYGRNDSDASEETEYEDEDDIAGGRRRKARPELKVASQDRVYELFDPADLARYFCSAEDQRIHITDVPERFQLRAIPVRQLNPESPSYKSDLIELEKEAEWIYNVAFKEGISKKSPTVTDSIFDVLKFIKESLYEVPFIAFYRKEFIKKDLNINDLWCIYEFDEKWEILQRRRKGLIGEMERMGKYLEALTKESDERDKDKRCDGLNRLIAMAKSAISVEEVHDVRLNYLLYYAGHTEDLLIWEGKNVNIDRQILCKESENVRSSVGRPDASEGEEEDEDYDPSYGVRHLSMTETHIEKDKERQAVTRTNREALKEFGHKRDSGASVVTITVDPMTGRRLRQRQVRTTAAYGVAQRVGIGGLVDKFGLSAEQFADNVRDQYRRHEVNPCPMLPLDAAAGFVCKQFADPSSALCAARYMLALQISREPVVRQLARMNLSTQTVVDLKPTCKGLRIIDESHPLCHVKFLKNKPVSELMGDVTYLHIHNAVRDGLVTIEMRVPECQQRGLSLLEDLQHFFHQDEFSDLVQAWNEQRSMVLKEAVERFLQPQIFKEIQEKLLELSQEAVLKMCAQKLFKCIKVAPYVVDDDYRGGEANVSEGGGSSRHHREGRYLSDSSSHSTGSSVWPKPARVLAFALKDDTEVTKAMVTVVQLDADGEVVDFLNLPGLLHSARSQREEFRKRREDDVRRLCQFLKRNEPQAIVVGCNSRRSVILKEEVQRLVENLTAESRLSSRPNIELMDTELAEVYARSEVATSQLPSSYSVLLKQAISLGRRLQDPLAEFAQLFNFPDAEILGVRWHAVQDELPREKLLRALEIEFINRTNEVGVDVNRCILHPHTANLLQFVGGLGPRKAFYMTKIIKQKKIYLTSREQMTKVLHLGPHITLNCAGFIKIDTTLARDLSSSGDNIEILDSTRVHPESYDLARQMAVDALEYDEGDDSDPTGALEEIIQSPARLRELDLDAFAEELKRQDHGDRHITLYDIRKELNHRYRDLRDPFEPLTPEQIFSLATHETPETLHKGSIVDCQVISIVTKKPKPEQLDQANPTKNEVTGLWRCPFCRRDDFRQLNEMWSHFDSSDCPGQPVGLRVQLENGISGFIPMRFIDNPAESTLDNASPGTILQAKVTKIDITKFSVELTLRSSDIQDERHMSLSRRDAFFDYVEEEAEQRRQEEEEVRAKARAERAYVNRVIFHPHFRNITYNQLVSMNSTLEVGAIVIRPSRKGIDHLTISLKVDDGIFKHIDVIEKDKPQFFELGKTLIIGNEKFEDLDEIVARYLEPMVSLIREIHAYKYYLDSQGGKLEILVERLRKEKNTSRNKIPYFLSSMSKYPGYFLLAYMPNQTPRFEMFSVKSEGLKFRHMIFSSLDRMIGWFKTHYNDVRSQYDHHRSNESSSGYAASNITRTLKLDNIFNAPFPHGPVALKPS